jgi:hypothetical protein
MRRRGAPARPARDGEIYPPPEKVGREWMVDERAVRQRADQPRASVVDRLRAAEA